MSDSVEKDVSIDQYRLDEEWVAQPQKYFRYAKAAADARRDYDQAKTDLDLTKAELDQTIRDNPGRFNIGKVTETAIVNTIPTCKEFKQARQKISDAKYLLDVMEAAVGAMDHRKKALEKLVDLHMAAYFSKPRASVEAREGMDETEKRGRYKPRGARDVDAE